MFNKYNNYNEANFFSLTLLHNLSNNYVPLFSKYYIHYFTLFKKTINYSKEYFNNSTLNWSLYLLNYYFGKWLKSNTTKSNDQLKEFVDPFKEYIEI